jgi:ABC-2 type transport system permease protein
VFSSIENLPTISAILSAKIIELLFYSFFVLLLISNSVAHIGNVYTADNMNLFLSAPISSSRLFTAKFVESLFETAIMYFVFISPVLFALCYSLNLPKTFLLEALVLSIPFLIIPAALAFVFSTLFVRLAARIWKRGAFFFVFVIGILLWLLYSLLTSLNGEKIHGSGTEAIVRMIGLFDNPNPIWLPSRWISEVLSAYISGPVANHNIFVTLLFSTAFGSIALAFLLFDLCAFSTRSKAATQSRGNVGKKNTIDRPRQLLELIYLPLPIPPQIRAIILKDITCLLRDRAQSMQLLLYTGIAFAYLVVTDFMSLALDLAPRELRVWWCFLGTVNILFSGFIISALMTRLIFPSISMEGRAFWILNSGPIRLKSLLNAKFWCWFPLVLTIALALTVSGACAIKVDASLIIVSAFVSGNIAVGATGLALGTGSMFASFDWETPSQISSGFGTLALLLSSLTLVAINTVPASIMIFIVLMEEVRIILGPYGWPSVFLFCGFSIFAINRIVAKKASERGVAALTMRYRSD